MMMVKFDRYVSVTSNIDHEEDACQSFMEIDCVDLENDAYQNVRT